MPLVNAKCTNCGANLQVDNTKDAAICQYCGSAYIVEKAINNYNTVNHIHAEVVNIYGGNSADFVIRGGVLEKYNGAATHVSIPDSVQCIAKEAFMDTYVEHVRIPNSVQSIGVNAFCNCRKLQDICIPNSVIEIQGGAFRNCISLVKVILPNGIKTVAGGTFANCINLISINIPKSITYIAEPDGKPSYFDNVLGVWMAEGYLFELGAFDNCPKLKNVDFEDKDTAERMYKHFPNSPIACMKRTEEEEKQKKAWRRAHVCDLCGGNFKGILSKRCTECGKEKQY